MFSIISGERSVAQYGYMGDSATLLCRNASAVIENIMIQTHRIPSIKWHKSRHQSTDHTMWDTVAMVTTDSDGSPILTLLGDLLNERASVELTSGNLTIFQLELWDESAYWCDIAGSHTDFVDLKVYGRFIGRYTSRMTSSSGSFIRVTVPFCGEFTGTR